MDLSPSLSGLGALAVYLVLGVIVFAESGLLLGFFLPGDTVLFAAGLLSARPSSGVSLPVLLAVVLVAATVGDAVGYSVGRRAGRPLLSRRRGRVLGATNMHRAERFYQRFGAFAVVAARFVPWLRTFTPILAGIARMSYPRFLLADAIGAVCWGAGILVIGYLSGGAPLLGHLSVLVAVIAVLVGTVGGLLSWRRARRGHR